MRTRLKAYGFGIFSGVLLMMIGLSTERIIVLNNEDGSVTIRGGSGKKGESA